MKHKKKIAKKRKLWESLWFLLGSSIFFGYLLTAFLLVILLYFNLDMGLAIFGFVGAAWVIGRKAARELKKPIEGETLVNLSLLFTLFQFILGIAYLRTNNIVTEDNFMGLMFMSVVFFVLVLFFYKKGVVSILPKAYFKKIATRR